MRHKGTERGLCGINREKLTNGANASYVNVNFAAYVLYMCVLSSSFSSFILMSYVKWNPRFLAVIENDMTLCPNERENIHIEDGEY